MKGTGCLEDFYKQKVAQSFGQASKYYNEQAQLQKNCAEQLLNLFEPYRSLLPKGAILEVGCGTGFVTQGIVQCFPQRQLEITDLSAEMVNFCQAYVQVPSTQTNLVNFRQMDGEAITAPPETYALIISSFALQWFKKPAQTLKHWLDKLKPNGLLLVAFPSCQSFPEWRRICEQLNLPYTANSLPNPEVLIQHQPLHALSCLCKEELIPMAFNSAADFLRGLKLIGAGTSQTEKRLSVSQMRQLIQSWNHQTFDKVVVHYHVVFMIIQRVS